MFYSIPSKSSKRDAVVSYSKNLARAFALTGLFRSLTSDAPIDLIYLYIKQTDLAGLGWHARETAQASTDGSLALDTMKEMAKNFMIHTFWNQAECLCGDMFSQCACTHNGDYIKRTYPISVRKALRALVIPLHASLDDIKDQINALYAAIIPTPLDNRVTATTTYCRAVERDQYGLLDNEEIMNLGQLESVLSNFMYSDSRSWTLPNHELMQTFCNLIDVLIVLEGVASFHEALSIKQIYDFSMKGTLMNCNNRHLSDLSKYDTKRVYSNVETPNEAQLAAVAFLSKLTPQAALCIGAQFRVVDGCPHVDSYDYLAIPQSAVSKSIRPYREVEIYISREIDIINRKLDDLSSAIGDTKTTNGCLLICEDESCGCSGC